MDESTERFLALLEKQNAAIAALEAEKESQRPQVDAVRVQRDQERREKWGQLRAREKPSRRPTRARRVFPRIDVS